MGLSDKGKGEQLLKGGVLPDKFANLLVGKDSKDKGGSMVDTYAKVMDAHVTRHFETFAATVVSAGATINPLDFIYYNTYGDYRMVLKDSKIAFEYRAIRTGDIGGLDHRTDTFTRVLHTGSEEGLYGVYDKTTLDATGNYTLKIADIPQLTQELNRGSSGLRFMLPSVGTLLAMTYGYTNINKELHKAFQTIIDKIDSLMKEVDESFNIVEYLCDRFEPSINSATLVADFAAFRTEAVRLNDDENLDTALEYMADQLIETSTSRFSPPEKVQFKENANIPNAIEIELAPLVPAGFDVETYTYIVRSATPSADKKRYSYEIEPEDAAMAGTVSDVDQKLLVGMKEPTRAFTKKKESFFAIPAEATIVAYSEIFDQIFALHNYAYICQKKNFNFGYISPAVNKSAKKAQIPKDFPRMFRPSQNDAPSDGDYTQTKKVSQNNSFIKNILQIRNAYVQMILKAQRASATDTRVFDEFYKGDLGLKEINWLAYMLSEEGKVVVKQPEKVNILSQLSYVPTGAANEVQLYGEANRRTLLFSIDIPMLKDVMLEYINAFNELTIRSAYSLEPSKGGKEGVIAKALWGSIRKRTGKLFEDLEIVPFRFFTNLFNGVNRVINDGETITFDPYPPNWTDTNLLTQLTIDPAELDSTLTVEEYTQRLSEYLDYLFLRYGNRPRIAAAVLTAIEGYRVSSSTKYTDLRSEFVAMIEEHNKKSQLKGTDIVFQAYTLVLSIMRAELEVPVSLRDDYIAEGYEREGLSAILKDRNYEDRLKIQAAPPGHPLHKPTEKEEKARAKGQILTVAAENVMGAAPNTTSTSRGIPADFGDFGETEFKITTDAGGNTESVEIVEAGSNFSPGDQLIVQVEGGLDTVPMQLTVKKVSE